MYISLSDSWLYNFFIGRELNPRVGNLDLKMFALLRLGLISWVALNSIYLMRHFKDMGPIPLAPGLIAAFQIFYVCDALWFEVSSSHISATSLTLYIQKSCKSLHDFCI